MRRAQLISEKMSDWLKLAFALWAWAVVKEVIRKRFGLDMQIRQGGVAEAVGGLRYQSL